MSGNGEAVALVVLQSPAGPPLDTDLTAATLAPHLPDQAAIGTVQAELVNAGFKVGPAVGISFSIEGTADLFQRYFGITPVQSDDGAWTAAGGEELPLGGFPARERELVRAVVFEPRADLMGGST